MVYRFHTRSEGPDVPGQTSQVRGLARGWAPAFTPDAIMGVRELLAMLELPPRGPVQNRALATKVLDLLSASQTDHPLTLALGLIAQRSVD